VTLFNRTLRLLALGAVALVVALGALVAFPSTATAAPAQDRQVRNYYGAIAISVDQAWGVSYDYRTKRAAKRSARNRCQNHSSYPRRCEVTVWVRNGCAATAVKTNRDGFVTRYAWGIGRSPRQAKRRALSELTRPKKILTWVCTTR
jgi:hypothetical protein